MNLKSLILSKHKVNALSLDILAEELGMSRDNPILIRVMEEIRNDKEIVRGDDLVDIVAEKSCGSEW